MTVSVNRGRAIGKISAYPFVFIVKNSFFMSFFETRKICAGSQIEDAGDLFWLENLKTLLAAVFTFE